MRYRVLDQNGLNFFTFTIVDWIDLFTRPVYMDMLIDSLSYCQKNKGLDIFGYVIMPSHIHLIAQTLSSEGISKVIQNFKSYTASQILKHVKNKKSPESRRDWLLHHFAFHAQKNRTHSRYQVWQRDNHPIVLFTPKVIRQKLAYIHFNPVKSKIVSQPEHYVYSSASNYIDGTGVLSVSVLDDIWNDIGLVS